MESTARIGKIELVKKFAQSDKQPLLILSPPEINVKITVSLPDICFIDKPQIQLSLFADEDDLEAGLISFESTSLNLRLGTECKWLDEKQMEYIYAIKDGQIQTPIVPKGGRSTTIFSVDKWRFSEITDVHILFQTARGQKSFRLDLKLFPPWEISMQQVYEYINMSFKWTAEPIRVKESWIITENSEEKRHLMTHDIIMGCGQIMNRILKSGDSLALITYRSIPNVYVFPRVEVKPIIIIEAEITCDDRTVPLGMPIQTRLVFRVRSRSTIRMTYEIIHIADCWLISGLIQDTITLENDDPYELSFSLIPIRTGALSLPTLTIITHEVSSANVKIRLHPKPVIINVEKQHPIPGGSNSKTFVI